MDYALLWKPLSCGGGGGGGSSASLSLTWVGCGDGLRLSCVYVGRGEARGLGRLAMELFSPIPAVVG